MVMMGCKDKEETPTTDSGRQQKQVSECKQECLSLEEYEKLSTLLEKAEWLTKYGKAVCEETLHESTQKTHELKVGDFTTATNGGLVKNWEYIKNLTQTYSVYAKYVSFEIDIPNKQIKDLKIVDTFDDTIPCYSLALFRSIAKKNNYNNISFEFLFAEVNTGGETIIIKVANSDGTISYFDYSDEPRLIENQVASKEKSPL